MAPGIVWIPLLWACDKPERNYGGGSSTQGSQEAGVGKTYPSKACLWYPLLPTRPCLLTVYLVMDLLVE